MESFHKKLQISTATQHATLENTRLMKAIACNKVNVHVYRQYLVCQHRIFAPLEAQLRSWVQPDMAAVRLVKATWLLTDLQALGCQSSETSAAIPDITSEAHALGVQYVLEGSMLGLRVIKNRLPQEHPMFHQAGRFVEGYGTNTSNQWKAFLSQLEAVPQEEWHEATAAALATFEAFHSEFSRTTDV